jgi:hypothetical protein
MSDRMINTAEKVIIKKAALMEQPFALRYTVYRLLLDQLKGFYAFAFNLNEV